MSMIMPSMSIFLLRTSYLTLAWLWLMRLSLPRGKSRKFYPKLILSLHHFPNFLEVTTKLGDDDLDVEDNKALFDAILWVLIGAKNITGS